MLEANRTLDGNALRYWRMLGIALLVIWFVTSIWIIWDRPSHPPPPSTESQAPESRVLSVALPERLASFFHLFLPVCVIILEGYVLLCTERERRERALERAHEKQEREKARQELQIFRETMGRADYLHDIAKAIDRAETEIVFTTATMEASWNNTDQVRILDSVVARAKEKKYVHRGLVAKKPATISGAVELLCFTHIDLRFTEVMAMSRLRFLVRDREYSVIGVVERPANLASETPTTKSFSVESGMLGAALHARFEQLWDNGTSVWSYLDDLVNNAKATDAAFSQKSLLDLLVQGHSKRTALHSALLEKYPTYKALPP